MWALVETALWFPSSGGRCSSVHGCGSVHAVVELREDVRDLHHLTGHYPIKGWEWMDDVGERLQRGTELDCQHQLAEDLARSRRDERCAD